MFFLNNPIEITAYTSFLFVWAVNLFRVCRRDTLFHQYKKQHIDNKNNASINDAPAGISVIVLTHNQEKLLPALFKSILEQDYDNYEVVAVDQNSTDNTRIVLEDLSKRYEQIQYTFVPQGTRQLSVHTLALTLGVKAARYPWVLVITPDFQPVSHQWLACMATEMTSAKDFILGARSTTPDSCSLRSFYYLSEQYQFLSWAQKHHAYQCNEVNLAFRKACFLSYKNLGEYGKLLSGIENILVNRFSNKQRTAVCIHPEALLQEVRYGGSNWKNELLYQKETEQLFSYKRYYRWRKALRTTSIWLLFLLSILTITLSILTKHWEYTGSISLLLIIWICLRIKKQKQKARIFQIKSLGVYLPFYELRLWCLHIMAKCRLKLGLSW